MILQSLFCLVKKGIRTISPTKDAKNILRNMKIEYQYFLRKTNLKILS